MTVSNAVAANLRLKVPFKTGAANDGGLHLAGKHLMYLDADGATYNGGVFLDSNSGLLVAPAHDGAFGAVPAEPADSVFVRGSSTVLFGDTDLALQTNRNVLISSGRTFNVIAKAGKTLTIHGEINGEHEPGALPTTTRMISTYRWTPTGGNWKGGLVVLDPGEGRTNNVGRLTIEGNTEIKSGTTIVNGTSLNDAAPLYVHGSGATAEATTGTLTLSGGEVVVSPDSASKFVQVGYYNAENKVSLYGLLDVCGGTLKTSGGEFLNALGAGCTVIRDGGVIDCDTFRPAQYMTNNPVVLRLEANGLLRARQLWIDSAANKTNIATIVFNGGALQTTHVVPPKTTDADINKRSFVNDPLNAAWDRITFAVGPGGAVFDVSNSNNLWWYRPLVSGVAAGESDGGLTVRGAKDWSVCIMVPQSYNGPTTVDRCTLQQRGGDNQLPSGAKLVLMNNGYVIFNKYDSANTPTEATFSGISGDGRLENCTKVSVTGTIAPSIGGTIEFRQAPKSLSGPIEIAGDATGCGKVKFDEPQDLSTLSLSVADIASFDKNAAKDRYQIVEGNYTGRFSSVAGLPDDWAVSYRADGVYLSHIDAFVLVVR